MQSSQFAGTIFIVFGVMALLYAAGDILFRVLVGILALHAINYGLRLRRMQSLHVMIYRWFDRFSF